VSAHQPPHLVFEDAIKRALGWSSEGELRRLIKQRTGVTLSLTEANALSQEIAEIVITNLRQRPDRSST